MKILPGCCLFLANPVYAHVHIFNEILPAKFDRPTTIMKLSTANRTTPPKIRLFLARRFYITLLFISVIFLVMCPTLFLNLWTQNAQNLS